MENQRKSENEKSFFSNPNMVEHYALLEEIGIFSHIDSLEQEITNYKNLFAGALDIVNRTTIAEIMDAAVWQISDYFLPSIIVFLWKPLLNREDLTIKCFKNYEHVDLDLRIDSINFLEPFFRDHPGPVSYKSFSSELGQNKIIESFDVVDPALIIPILGPSGLYGMVLLGHNILGEDYNKRELEFIQNLMSFVSKAIQNHLHYERTLRDPKTGLYNNCFFMNRLNEEINRIKRSKNETSIIIMDVDHFKNFNDSYGHIAGDKVLETLAITIKQGVRLGDVPSRFGGEEFTVLLPDTGKDLAWGVAERLRTMVEGMKVESEPPLPQVTISLGLFTLDKETNITADEIISRADEALYLSKKAGRNRTTAWGTEIIDKMQHFKSSL